MEKTKIENEESANDSKAADDVGSENSQKKATGRRLKDSIVSKDPLRKLNLDRRTARSDRRGDRDPNYKGPSRRYTIDRRLSLKDRRKDGK
jgi:hypothetical protein